jgi:hypothetical protein
MPKLLKDIVTDALAAEADVELVDSLGPGADLVIGSFPEPSADVVERILREQPRVKVLGVEPTDGSAYLTELRPYRRVLGQVSPGQLVQVIRGAAREGAYG